MPLYEYKCQSCGDVFEVIEKFSDPPLAVHAKCGGPVERLISTSALQFKGSGWYVNDYGKGKSKEPKPAASNGDSKSGDSKPDKAGGSSTPAETTTTKSDTSSSTTPAASKPDSK